jgi:hypothetical protein
MRVLHILIRTILHLIQINVGGEVCNHASPFILVYYSQNRKRSGHRCQIIGKGFISSDPHI